jgi:rare lipoprotein A
MASFYSPVFEGRITSSGAPFSNAEHTAAHRTLPFGTLVRVTNLTNDKSVIVEITDRGPFVANRIIDLSQAAARDLDFIEDGVVPVRLEVVSQE